MRRYNRGCLSQAFTLLQCLFVLMLPSSGSAIEQTTQPSLVTVPPLVNTYKQSEPPENKVTETGISDPVLSALYLAVTLNPGIVSMTPVRTTLTEGGLLQISNLVEAPQFHPLICQALSDVFLDGTSLQSIRGSYLRLDPHRGICTETIDVQ